MAMSSLLSEKTLNLHRHVAWEFNVAFKECCVSMYGTFCCSFLSHDIDWRFTWNQNTEKLQKGSSFVGLLGGFVFVFKFDQI